MRLLFDLVHPAHVHLFRNLIGRARAQGWETLAATREKDVTLSISKKLGSAIKQRLSSKEIYTRTRDQFI